MTWMNSFPDILRQIGYNEKSINDIHSELDDLCVRIEINKLKRAVDAAGQDRKALIAILKELILSLENKGYYRPDYPTKLIMLLVNGLNLKGDDIFSLLDQASISPIDKSEEKEFLASCAAITQLGYILLRYLMGQIKAASSGPHVFLVIDDLSPDSMMLVDFSIDSIIEIDTSRFENKDSFYCLRNIEGLDNDTTEILKKYYAFFHVTTDIGLSHNIHNNLGIAYERIGMYESGIDELHEALRLDPDYAEAHNNLAVIYEKMEMAEEAIKELHEALRLNPDYAQGRSNLGKIYARLGNYEDAIAQLKDALNQKPEDPIIHNNLGHVYALQNKNDDAIKEFGEALRANPDYAPAHNNLGTMYSKSKRNEEALIEFQKALHIDPGFAEAYHGIGSIYYDAGRFDRAAQAWVRAVYLEPELLESVPDKLMLKVRQGVSRLK